MNSQQRLFARYIQELPAGQLNWIGVRPARKADLIQLPSVMAVEGQGLEGDHRMGKTKGSARQVTIISQEYINLISHFLEGKAVSPSQLRRNLVVSNINLTALRYQTFQIGQAIFEASALCHPCSRMEKILGKGGIAAMLGHGGLCCKVLQSGEITVGDKVELLKKNGTDEAI